VLEAQSEKGGRFEMLRGAGCIKTHGHPRSRSHFLGGIRIDGDPRSWVMVGQGTKVERLRLPAILHYLVVD